MMSAVEEESPTLETETDPAQQFLVLGLELLTPEQGLQIALSDQRHLRRLREGGMIVSVLLLFVPWFFLPVIKRRRKGQGGSKDDEEAGGLFFHERISRKPTPIRIRSQLCT